MKDELSKLESANQKARADYEQSQELAKVTDEQFEAVSLRLKGQTWPEWIMGHSFAFALGVVSSLAATFLWQWRPKRKLAKPSLPAGDQAPPPAAPDPV